MKDEKLKSYHQEYLIKQADQFEEIKFILLIRDNNQLIEVLYSILALIIQIGYDKKVQYVSIKIKNDFTDYCLVEKETNGKLWYHNIIHFIISCEYSFNTNKMDKKTFNNLQQKY
jgi:uncharacterized protein YcsI (UPF0317 family)